MSAVDKLHKLYSTTFEPVVWARSIGVEVLNEFDSVKAAIMMVAGGHSRHSNEGQTSGWTLATGGVQAMVMGLNTANVVKDRITDTVREGLRGLLRKRQQL
jgi:ubiquinone biosynthesis monooxygenase Coq6